MFLDEPDHVEYVGAWAPDGGRFVFECLGPSTCGNRTHVYDHRARAVQHDNHRFASVPRWSRDGRLAVWTRTTDAQRFAQLHDVR